MWQNWTTVIVDVKEHEAGLNEYDNTKLLKNELVKLYHSDSPRFVYFMFCLIIFSWLASNWSCRQHCRDGNTAVLP